ncbi:MAG: type 2 isopentenyl-diphosphate Delta-isomerase [Bacteroidetes bacterium]|nr:type 2 isopentenyl-diphosphate Delta-isomerase [Bacteroidota bacterium]
MELCVREDVAFHAKTTGLELFELEHNALPELDLEDVATSVTFLGKECSMPLIVGSMTGGYSEAERINRELGEVCETLRIPMGVGSQRQTLASADYVESFRAARRAGPTIPLFGNLGAAEIARGVDVDAVRRLSEMVGADAFAIHLNPLQELMQPEGTPRFRGVLRGIESLARSLEIPLIVKEVGAGLSARTIARLLDAGVRIIDVAGAGGTSWAGVELLRRSDAAADGTFWDWGIPTADAIAEARTLCENANAVLIASGGITSPREIAVAIALGAHTTAAARPLLKTLLEEGQPALHAMLAQWGRQLRGMMFLTGSATIAELRSAPLRRLDRART